MAEETSNARKQISWVRTKLERAREQVAPKSQEYWILSSLAHALDEGHPLLRREFMDSTGKSKPTIRADAGDAVTRVLHLREAGNVERCHTLPHHGSYSVGKHCYDMLALLLVLHPEPPTKLLRAVIYHDAHERWIGDIPGALKYLSPALAKYLDQQKEQIDHIVGYTWAIAPLSIEETRWLKAVDRIEFFLWCSEQVDAMGNKHITGRLTAIKNQLREMYSSGQLPQECMYFLDMYEWHRTSDDGIKPKEGLKEKVVGSPYTCNETL